MLGFGVLIAAVAPNQRIAAGIGSLLLLPLMFFAGLWVPQAQMGAALRDASHYIPLGAAGTDKPQVKYSTNEADLYSPSRRMTAFGAG